MTRWPSSAENPTDFNAHILKQLCLEGHPQCVEECLELFRNWTDSDGERDIHPYLKSVVFPTVSKHGTSAQWEYLYSKALKDPNQLQVFKLWTTEDSRLIRRLLKDTVFKDTEEPFKGNAYNSLLALHLSSKNNFAGALVVWDLIKSNWKQLYASFGEVDIFGELLASVFANFDTSAALHELLYAASTLQHLEQNPYFPQGVEHVTFNIKWNELYLEECVQVFREIVQ